MPYVFLQRPKTRRFHVPRWECLQPFPTSSLVIFSLVWEVSHANPLRATAISGARVRARAAVTQSADGEERDVRTRPKPGVAFRQFDGTRTTLEISPIPSYGPASQPRRSAAETANIISCRCVDAQEPLRPTTDCRAPATPVPSPTPSWLPGERRPSWTWSSVQRPWDSRNKARALLWLAPSVSITSISCFTRTCCASQLVGSNVRNRPLSNSGNCATPLDFIASAGVYRPSRYAAGGGGDCTGRSQLQRT